MKRAAFSVAFRGLGRLNREMLRVTLASKESFSRAQLRRIASIFRWLGEQLTEGRLRLKSMHELDRHQNHPVLRPLCRDTADPTAVTEANVGFGSKITLPAAPIS
jgi:hypothetical protein